MPDPRRPDNTNRLLLAAAIGLVLFLVAGLLFAQELPAGTKLEPRAALAISQATIGRTVGDYTLRDGDGTPVRLAAMRGKPIVVSFIYTGCFQVCPATTKFLEGAIKEAQRALGRDAFHVVTVGFNLPFDTPEAMRDFRKRQGVALPNWRFIAADVATRDGLARDLGFVWTPSAGGFDHLTQATIIDGQGRVHRQIYGESFELPMLVAPLRALITGAPAPIQDLAGLLERVRILCTIYDPSTGRYGLDYRLFIEIFAGLTILGATAWYLIAEWRRQRAPRTT